MSRVFLLSPASCHGERARLLLDARARFDLARRLETGVPLGEAFAFLSGLYFRGKLLYALRFADPPAGAPGVLVITPSAGLRPPEERVTRRTLEQFAAVPIDAGEMRYLEPLMRDALLLRDLVGADCEIVLLGSVASDKYGAPLQAVFGRRLVFPPAFVGRGDMSRGGLLLRSRDTGEELPYLPLSGAVRHGPRPPRLAPRSAKGSAR